MSPSEPYYKDDLCEIYCGDSGDLLAELSDRADLILADPPYGISHPTSYGDRNPTPSKKLPTARRNNYARVFGDDEPFDPEPLLATGNRLILWGANHYADKLPPSGGWLVWDKQRPHELDQSTCELAWTNCSKGVRVFSHLWNGAMKASENNRPLCHPTQKPVALMKWVLSLKWLHGVECVLDPYMGSGPVLRAAKDMGIRSIGVEIVEEYCELAAQSLSQGSLFEDCHVSF